MCFATIRELDGSCMDAAKALGLSPLATLALRLSLMILTRIAFRNADRCLKVNIASSSASIRVSRLRRSSSNRNRETACMEEAGFGYTATTPPGTDQPLQDALSFHAQRGKSFEP